MDEPSAQEIPAERGASDRASALLFWAQIVGNAGLFVGLLLVTRALGPSGRGTVAFITVTALVTAWIARFGVTEATVVFAAQRREARPVLLTNSLVFSTAAGLAGAVVVCGTLWLEPALRPDGVGSAELAILGMSILAACLADAGYRFLLGCSRFRAHALVTAITSWVYPVLVVTLWAVLGLTVAVAALVWAATQGLRALLLFSVATRREGGFGRPSLRLFRESISFGVRAWVGTLADSLGFRIDQILIALIASEAALGFYVVAVNLSEVLLYFPGAVSMALLPLAAGSDAGSRLSRTLRAFRSASVVTLASLLVSAVVVPPLIPVVFGGAFVASIIPFLLMLPGLVGFTAMIVFSNALMASSLPSLSSVPSMICFVVGLALDLALIPFFEASGAAAAASAAYLAGGLSALLIYRSRFRFLLPQLIVPQPGDFETLRALAPSPFRRASFAAEVRSERRHNQSRQPATKEVRPMIERHSAAESVSMLRALEPPPEQPVDVRRYANALRRSRGLITAIVVTLTGLVLALSLVLPKAYSAKATILLDQSPEVTAAADAERQLATIQTLLTTRGVLAAAARRLPGESAETLAGNIQATVDPAANIIRIRASATNPHDAARIANAVATAFLARQRNFELRRLQAARSRLVEAMTRLSGTPGSKGEIALIRERLSELSVSEANAGSELQMADAARPPVSADSPRPLRNAVFAFVAALFIGVLVALGRERLAPRLNGAQELEQLSGVPVLAEIQLGRRGLNASNVSHERESYDALAAAIGMQLPPGEQHILLVTSAVADEASEKVTAGLGRALAQAGETTLVVDADLRRPSLEQLFGMEPAPGLAEILTAARNGDADAAGGMITEPPASASGRRASGSLAVLGAGTASPGAPLTAEALEIFFGELSHAAFTYVVIQGPPMLSPNDSRLWVQRVDGVIVVSRPDRLAPDDVLEARGRLERVGGNVIGHVVVDV